MPMTTSDASLAPLLAASKTELNFLKLVGNKSY